VLLSQRKEVRSYKVALGGQPIGPKTRHGDHRTPEGAYILDSRNPNSHFYKAFHISYPNPKDLAAAKKSGGNPGGRSMHGWERRTFYMTGRMDASRSRTKRWTNFGNWFASVLPLKSNLDPRAVGINSTLTCSFRQSLRGGLSRAPIINNLQDYIIKI
jgi:hypothetical protein